MAVIPNDLWTEILLNLPAVTVARFRSLSKFHQELIDDPEFRRRHSHHKSIKPTQSYVIVRNYEDIWNRDRKSNVDDLVYFDSSNPNSFPSIHRLIPPDLNQLFDKIHIFGCCQGIVGLWYESKHSDGQGIMFWNPLTGSCRKTSIPIRHPRDPFQYYIGHDSASDDLKVLKVQKRLRFWSCEDIFEIYSSKTDCWKEVNKGVTHIVPYDLRGEYCSDVIEGANALHIAVSSSIVAFDLSTEEFSVVPTPEWRRSNFRLDDYDDDNAPGLRYPFSLDGCLCFHEMGNGCIAVWMMKHYGVKDSWTKLFSVDDKSKVSRALQFSTDGSKVILCGNTSSAQMFYSYDLEKKRLSKLFTLSRPRLSCNKSYLYTPSLKQPYVNIEIEF